MRIWTLAFLVGIILIQQFSVIPHAYLDVALVGAIIFALATFKYYRVLRLPAATVLGCVWALWFADLHMNEKLPLHLEGQTIPIRGYIASIPNVGPFGVGFLFSLTDLNNQPAQGLVKLMWNNTKIILHVGEQWQFSVRLKKPYGTMDPGGFDYEAYAFQEGIIGSGYVRAQEPYQLLSNHWYKYPLDRAREYFKQKIAANLPSSNTSPWITALVIGERNNIDPKAWQVLRNTGTNHLMAIAGLHIGFMALLAHVSVAFLWRRMPKLMLKITAVHAGAIAALVMAFVYSGMAGFSIPTQRACSMLAVFLFTLLLRRNIVAWQAWNVALLCVLLLNPLSVLTESFWLSFGSVALIIYGVGGRLSPSGLWWKIGRIQWVIALGLIPFSIWLFQQCSLISFIANSIAIPWVGFVVAPLSFFAALLLLISAHWGGMLLQLADKILSVLWIILTWFAHLPHVVWYQTIAKLWILLTAVGAVVLMLLPIGFPGRYLSIIWLLPILLYKPAVPAEGAAWLTLLDVGQGLSAIVQTRQHVLVFDTGARLSVSYDMGDSVVVPFLHAIGAQKVDMLVISHGDNDHKGGAAAVMQQFPIGQIKTSVPELFPHASYCLRGTSWLWDGVRFEFLFPDTDNLGLDNNSSCVLRVTAGDKHVLLTGDIEKLAEHELVQSEKNNLSATILIAPHHGSKTSADEKFIAAVNPKYVLFPIGYRNRYHFPHPSVLRKYQELHIAQYDTVKDGAIQFILQPDVHIALPSLFRITHKHYWNN